MAEPSTAGRPGRRRWAIWAAVTEDLLNDLVEAAIGDGVSMDPVEQQINLPAMGEVVLRMALTVTGVRFQCRGEDDGRARVTATGFGEVSARGSDYEGATLSGEALGMPAPPAPLPVRLLALCDPFARVNDDHSVSFGLNVRGAELLSLDVDHDAEVPEGVDPDVWEGILSMTSVMFAAVGEELFAGLGEAKETVGLDLGSDVGSVLLELGVDLGEGMRVSSGMVSIGLPATERVRGRAVPVPISGHRAALSLATSGVDHMATRLLESALGEVPLPVEIDIDLEDRRIAAGFRQPRLVSDRFPDIRSRLRTDVSVNLRGGRVEVSLASAWVELPTLVPSFVNDFNRRLGELWSMAPIRYRLPKRLEFPLGGSGGTRLGVNVDDLRVDASGLGVALVVA
ncbi:MAG: hypothetical protein M5U19_21945 [Microthrixaceae bacterium]|nr:hypothetical protein [Microthrixaceae bacterium]